MTPCSLSALRLAVTAACPILEYRRYRHGYVFGRYGRLAELTVRRATAIILGKGGVAQWLEQGNHNPCVRGSNPCTATTKGAKGLGRKPLAPFALRRPPQPSHSIAASCSKNSKAQPGAPVRALRGHWVPRRAPRDAPGKASESPLSKPNSVSPFRVPKGGGAHGYASAHCPHWLAGWCGQHVLPDDVSRRADCPLNGWTQGSDRCDHFERELLPEAPEAVKADYGWRTEPLEVETVTEPPHTDPGGTFREGREAQHTAGQRQCPGLDGKPCGVSLEPRRRLCDGCRRVARRETKREAQRRRRGKLAQQAVV